MKAYSFDVFDTCITRVYARPTDLFYDTSRVIMGLYPEIQKKHNLASLYLARIEAEREAHRRRVDSQEVSIFEIYEQLIRILGVNAHANELLEIELDIERKSIRPIVETRQLIETLRNTAKIIFISDMYLPAEFIESVMEDHGFLQNASDSLYVSSDIGLTKHHGDLYGYILDKEKILPGHLLHMGDNKQSDIRRARRYGISTRLYDKIGFTSLEKRTIKNDTECYTRLAGIQRASRLQIADSNRYSHELADLIVNIVAPFVIGFVLWGFERARQNGIKRLYFVSRDGMIFYKVASLLMPSNYQVECRYLYGSRQAWFLPSLFACTEDELGWAVKEVGMNKSLRDIFYRLGIDVSEIYDLLHDKGIMVDTDQELNASELASLIEVLSEEPLKSKILDVAAKERELAIRYFEQEGLLQDNDWAIVDVGWTLKAQKALNKILKSIGRNIEAKGIYSGVLDGFVNKDSVGNYWAYITMKDSSDPSRYKFNWYFGSAARIVLDHVFTSADHPHVKGYQEKSGHIYPAYSLNKTGQDNISLTKKIHDGVLKVAEEYKLARIHDVCAQHIMDSSVVSLERFINKPSKEHVLAVASILTNIEQSHHDRHNRMLASSLGVQDILSMVASDLSNNRQCSGSRYAWPAGSATISPPMSRLLFSLMQYMKQIRDVITR